MSTEIAEFFKLKSIDDKRGSLISIDMVGTLPFDVKRIYYLFESNVEITRGFHAHKSLKQLIVCVAGECKVILDDGKKKEQFVLNNPRKGLLICNCLWREIALLDSTSVLLVFADQHFDESDYIRDYNTFLNYVSKV